MLARVSGKYFAGFRRRFSGSGSGCAYTAADLVPTSTAIPANGEILGPKSFRQCRTASNATGDFEIVGLPPGNYTVSGTLSAYDGAVSGINSLRFRIGEGNATAVTLTSAGEFSETLAVAVGPLRFRHAVNGRGCRVDNFCVHLEGNDPSALIAQNDIPVGTQAGEELIIND